MHTKRKKEPEYQNPNELNELFDSYISECRFTRRLSPQTIKGYREVFGTFQKIVPELTTLESLNAGWINEFFRRVSTRKRHVGAQIKVGIRASTTSTYFNKLMAFFRWLENNDYIQYGSISQKMVKPPTPVYEDEKALSQESISKIVAAITLHGTDDIFVHRRDLAIVSTLLYTGIRRGELLGLRVQDLDFDRHRIFINHRTSKSNFDRYVPMHPKLALQLRSYLEERRKRDSKSAALFISSKRGTGLTEHGLKHWVAKYSELSGVSFHLHQFRHTFACGLGRSGVDVVSIRKLLGHTSIRMTERYLRSIEPLEANNLIEKLSF